MAEKVKDSLMLRLRRVLSTQDAHAKEIKQLKDEVKLLKDQMNVLLQPLDDFEPIVEYSSPKTKVGDPSADQETKITSDPSGAAEGTPEYLKKVFNGIKNQSE